MKKIISAVAVCFLGFSIVDAGAAANNAADRRSNTTQWGPGARAGTTSRNQLAALSSQSSIRAENPSAAVPVDKRDTEKKACVNNNVGFGNTFVWASRYSDTSNYSSMTEDTEEPDNNVCYVKVGLGSSDSAVDLSDIPTKYFVMNDNITCGSWVDQNSVKQIILDAKKKGRSWATAAAVVGGAGVGVGAMELFGNKAIGGKVEGQKSLSENELLRSKLLVLKKENPTQYNIYVETLTKIQNDCNSLPDGVNKPTECITVAYLLTTK